VVSNWIQVFLKLYILINKTLQVSYERSKTIEKQFLSIRLIGTR